MENSNILIPTHKKLTQENINSLLKDYKLENILKLPKIQIGDPGIKDLGFEEHDVVEILREGESKNEVKYWRVVTK